MLSSITFRKSPAADLKCRKSHSKSERARISDSLRERAAGLGFQEAAASGDLLRRARDQRAKALYYTQSTKRFLQRKSIAVGAAAKVISFDSKIKTRVPPSDSLTLGLQHLLLIGILRPLTCSLQLHPKFTKFESWEAFFFCQKS